MAFEIEEGVVHITADVDRSSLARAAKQAGEEAGTTLGEGIVTSSTNRLKESQGRLTAAGRDAGEGLGDGVVRSAEGRLRDARGRFVAAGRILGDGIGEGAEDGVKKRKGRMSGILKDLFTPDPNLFAKLKAPFAAALSTPIGAAATAIAAVFALEFAGAVVSSILGLGLGTILLGLGGLALFGGRENRQKALDDLEKAEKKVANAEFAARKGSATSLRNLAMARDQLAEAQKAVQDGKAFVALDKALENVQDTLKEVANQAAVPLLKPFTRALGDISKLAKGLGPDFKSIFTSLAPVVTMLTGALSGFARNVVSGLEDSMPGIVAAFKGLSQILPTVGQWIGDFFRTIFANSDVIDNVTRGLFTLVFGPLKLLGPLISYFTVIFGIWNNILGDTGYLMGVLTDAFLSWADGGTGALGRIRDAWGPVSDAIQNVWDKMVAFAGADTHEEIQTRFESLVHAINQAWGPLKDFLGVVWDEAWVIVKNIWDTKVVPWWENTASPWLKEKVGQAMEETWDIAIGIVTKKIGELISSSIATLLSWPARVGSALAGIPGRVSSAMSAAAAAARSGASALVNGAISIFATMAGRVSGALDSIRGRVIGAFGGAAGWLYAAGQSAVRGFINGVFSMFGALGAAAGAAGQYFKDHKGPIEKDRVMLVPEGRAIMDGLIAGFKSGYGNLASTLTGVSGAIPGLVSGSSAGLSLASNAGMAFSPAGSSSGSSGSPTSMSPSFDVKVYVGDKELKDTIRVEINEHDRSLGGQVSSGTGGFRL